MKAALFKSLGCSVSKVGHPSPRENARTATRRYRADLTAGALKIAESRLIADLLLRRVDEAGWRQAITKDNVLRAKNPATGIRLARLVRQRLEISGCLQP